MDASDVSMPRSFSALHIAAQGIPLLSRAALKSLYDSSSSTDLTLSSTDSNLLLPNTSVNLLMVPSL